MNDALTFGSLPRGTVFSPAKGSFMGRPFRKTAISPDTDEHGGNARYLRKLTKRDGDILLHPGRHPRCLFFRFQDGDEVHVDDPALAHSLRLASRIGKKKGRKNKKSDWFFDISPAEIDQIEQYQRRPSVRSRLMKYIRGCS